MFSKNGKISEKQLRRMVILPVFASVIFVVPYLSAKLLGGSVFPGLLVFFVLGSLYVLYMCGVGGWFAEQKERTGKEGFLDVLVASGLVGKTLVWVELARMVVRLAFYILLAVAVLQEAQVPFMLNTQNEMVTNLLVVLPLLFVCVYGAHTRVEKQGRICEMLFWILFIPFLILVLFGLQEVDYNIFVPRAELSFGKMLLYAYMLLTFVLPMEHFLYLRPHLHRDGHKGVAGVVVGTLLLAVILTLFMLGIYGVHGAGQNPTITVAIMRYIRLPFGILERFDVLMIWFFMIGCFVLICESLFFVGWIISVLFNRKPSKRVLIGILLLAVVIVMGVRNYENGLLPFVCYGAVLDVPLSIIIPLIGMGLSRFGDLTKENGEEINARE